MEKTLHIFAAAKLNSYTVQVESSFPLLSLFSSIRPFWQQAGNRDEQ